MIEAKAIESRFLFKNGLSSLNSVSDDEGQKLSFSTNSNGNQIVLTKDLEGIDVAIEHCTDGTKIFHMEKDSKGLPAMHEFKPDGTEIIYLFDAGKRLEKMVEMKINGDKLTTWFSARDEVISQEQRQQGGILFQMSAMQDHALIWLHPDGSSELHGEHRLLSHLLHVFNKFLDGISLE